MSTKQEPSLALEQAQIISWKMLALAEQCDWDQLPDLENKRKKIMESFFSQPVPVHDSAQVEKIIQDVLIINDQITALAEKEKVSIGQQRQNIKKRQNVQSAYLQNK